MSSTEPGPQRPAVAEASTDSDGEGLESSPAGENELGLALAKLRELGLHGEAAASHLAATERFELPPPEEIDSIRIMMLERDALPFHQGIVVGMFADVIRGLRSINLAARAVRANASVENVSLPYCQEIELVASSFGGDGRTQRGCFPLTVVARGHGGLAWRWKPALDLRRSGVPSSGKPSA